MRIPVTYLVIAMLALFIVPARTMAASTTESAPITMNKESSAVHASIMMDRLRTIEAMDKSEMSSSEKRELRKEVNGIKRHLKELDGGVYLSVGGIIIILLILILVL